MFQSSLWEQAAASLFKTCKKSDQGWFHPFSCPPSPVTSLVSFAEIKKKFWLHWVFTAQVFSISSDRSYPVVAVLGSFIPVFSHVAHHRY